MAEEKEEYIVDKNMLRFGSYKPEMLYFGSEAVGQVRWGSVVKYNRALYHIEAPDLGEIAPMALDVVSFLGKTVSFKTDADGVKTYIDYTCDPIPANTDETKSVYREFTLEQEVSGLQVTGSCFQKADYIMSHVITNMKITGVMYPEAAANGFQPMTPVASYSGTSTPQYASGKPAQPTSAGGTTSVFAELTCSLTPEGEQVGASINTSTGVVDPPYLGTTPTPRQAIAKITYLAIDIDGVGRKTWSGLAYAMQMANEKEVQDSDYFITTDVGPDELGAEGGEIEVSSSEAYKRVWYKWSSGEDGGYEDTDITLNVTVSGAVTGTYQLVGTDSVSLSVGSNSGTEERSVAIRISNTTANYDESYEIKQSARYFVRWVFGGYVVYVGYEEVGAGGGPATPGVSIDIIYYAEYSDGIDKDEYKTVDGLQVAVSSASGSAKNRSGATINKGTGVVSVNSLGENVTEARPVFYVESLSGTYYDSMSDTERSWSWSEGTYVEQAENAYHALGNPFYEYSSGIIPSDTAADGELDCTDTVIKVTGTARKGQKYYYDSYGPENAKTSYTNATLYVMVNQDLEGVQTLQGVNDSVTFDIGINTSTENTRSFLVEVYAKQGEGTYNQSYYLTQDVNAETVRWGAPTLNGDIVVEDLPANGEGQPIQVPIKQIKYTGVEGGTESAETLTGVADATAISGDAVTGKGVSFSGGDISASDLATNETAREKVYTLKKVTVTGLDGKSYTLTLQTSVVIYQEANAKEWILTGSSVDLGADSTSVSAEGGSVGFVVYASDSGKYEYTSGDHSDETKRAASGTLATNLSGGTLSSSTFTADQNGKSYTLSVPENPGSGSRTFNVTATATSGNVVSKSLEFTQAAHSYELYSNTLAGIGASGGEMVLILVSTRNGLPWAITASNIAVSGLTGAAVKSVTHEGNGEYKVVVTVPANTGAQRTFTVKATQPTSQKTFTWDATQTTGIKLKKAWFAGKFQFALNLSAGGVNYKSIMVSNSKLSAVGDAYGGGTVSNLYFKVVDRTSGAQYGISTTFESVYVADEGTADINLLVLSNTSGSSNVAVEMWFDGAKQDTYIVAEPPQSQLNVE